MQNSRLPLLASLGIAGILALLALTTATSVHAVVRSADHVAAVRADASTYLDLERRVAEEAISEAGYRRAPSPRARLRLESAVSRVDDALASVQSAGEPATSAGASHLRLLHRTYVAAVRPTLDRPSPPSVDDRVPGPDLASVQRLLSAATDERRTQVNGAIETQQQVLDRLTWVLPSVFLLAFSMLGWVWRTMLAGHRRLSSLVVEHESRALTDPLTGLANRAALVQRVEAALAGPDSHGAVLFLDLDRFKPVNDSLGHHAGDDLLRQVARRLGSTIRDEDTAARIGGDEFAVFLPRSSEAARVAHRVLRSIEAPFQVEGETVFIGTSIGIARFPQDGQDYLSLMRAADAALYRAKAAGRGRVEYAGLDPQPAS